MAKKAELESAYIRHANLCRAATEAEARRDYSTALRTAELGLKYLPFAIAYHRKFLPTHQPVNGSVDCVLRLAPPLFARRSLDALQVYAESRKKTERSHLPDLPDRIHTAREQMALAAQIWSGFSSSRTIFPEPKEHARTTSWLIEVWTGMGLIVAKGSGTTKGYAFVTDLSRDTWARCSACGVMRRAPALVLLDPSVCPSCGRQSEFVLAQRIV